MNLSSPRLEVSIGTQRLKLWDGYRLAMDVPCSTSKFGLGTQPGSNKTPLGSFKVQEKHGADAASGKKEWSVSLQKDLGGKLQGWGYTESVLVNGPHVFCTPGGSKGAIAALDKLTGKELWRFGTATEQGYSPPTIIKAAGVRQLILANPNAVNAVNPAADRVVARVAADAVAAVAIAEAIGASARATGGRSGGELVYLDESLYQFIPGVDFEDAIDSGPVLNGAADLILAFLSAG